MGWRRDLGNYTAKFFFLQFDPKGHASMANTKSAKKAIRKIARKTAVNKTRRSRMRTFIRRVEEAITAGEAENARTALVAAEPEIMRSAQKGILHKNSASRKISRLSARIKAMSA